MTVHDRIVQSAMSRFPSAELFVGPTHPYVFAPQVTP